MKKYLAMGIAVQAFIIGLRMALGKSGNIIKENKSNIYFWIGNLLGAIVNIVLWPFSILSEIILTKNGI